MYLEKLVLYNFKNYGSLNIFLNKKLNLIIGDNAQGKTNLIEAIYFLSTLSFFRNMSLQDVVKHNEKESRITGTLNNNGIEKEYSIFIKDQKRQQSINGKKISNIKEYFGNFFSIAYTPFDINLIEGHPIIRRKYFDRSVFYTDIPFIDNARKTNKILKERTALLKQRNYNNLSIYTDLFINEAAIYIFKRIKYINLLNKKLKEVYKEKLFGENEHISIKYSFLKKDIEEEINIEKIKESLEKKALEIKEEEKQQKRCLFGPHLDDFVFYLENHKQKTVASQGQKKSFLLALKLTELEILREKNPIFFIDDLTSELDDKRKSILMEYIQNEDLQVFITSTNINNLPSLKNGIFSKYIVADGQLFC